MIRPDRGKWLILPLGRFGDPRGNRKHEGIDLSPRWNQDRTLFAPEDGKEIARGTNTLGGNYILFQDALGFVHYISHLDRYITSTGLHSRKGEPIAVAGRTGNATGVTAHWEVRRNGVKLDPEKVLKAESEDRMEDSVIHSLWHFQIGKAPTKAQLKKWRGRSSNELDKHLEERNAARREVEKFKQGKGNPKGHMPQAIRKVYKPLGFEEVKLSSLIKEKLFKRK